MGKTLVTLVAVLAFSAIASAAMADTPDLPITRGLAGIDIGQTVTPPQVYVASHLTWNEAGPDATTVSGYTYQYFADSAQTGTALTGVTCTGAQSPFACSVLVPAFTPGAHSLTLESSDIAGTLGQSAAINFTFVVAPAIPTNLAIKH